MEIALLTTATAHHHYFAQRIHERFRLGLIVCESPSGSVGAGRPHPFEEARDAYEHSLLLQGRPADFSDLTRTLRVQRASDTECASAFRERPPDVVLVFGAKRLKPAVIEQASLACLNLHGGNPEEYRGLDTHLWAIYHRDFNNLVTTLHHVTADLDAGDIVFQEQLPLTKASRLHELRAVNTERCVDMTLLALTAFDTYGKVPSRRQVRPGRYYSRLPDSLKRDCVTKFDDYVATLQ